MKAALVLFGNGSVNHWCVAHKTGMLLGLEELEYLTIATQLIGMEPEREVKRTKIDEKANTREKLQIRRRGTAPSVLSIL